MEPQFTFLSRIAQELLEVLKWFSGETFSLKTHLQLLSAYIFTMINLNFSIWLRYMSTSFNKTYDSILNLQDSVVEEKTFHQSYLLDFKQPSPENNFYIPNSDREP